MSAHDELRDGMAEAFNALAAEFLSDTVVLLKASATEDEFEDVLEVENNLFFEFSKDRKQLVLEIAADNNDLTDAMAEATHVRIGTDAAASRVYVINDGDTTAPLSTDVTWKIFADLHEERPGQFRPL